MVGAARLVRSDGAGFTLGWKPARNRGNWASCSENFAPLCMAKQLNHLIHRSWRRSIPELGAELLGAGFDRRAMSHAFDLGSLVAACADRGWGVTLELPRGENVRTPSNATVSVHGPDGELEFSALERPIVAVARAMLAAAAAVAGNPDLAHRGLMPIAKPIRQPTRNTPSPPPRSSAVKKNKPSPA